MRGNPGNLSPLHATDKTLNAESTCENICPAVLYFAFWWVDVQAARTKGVVPQVDHVFPTAHYAVVHWVGHLQHGSTLAGLIAHHQVLGEEIRRNSANIGGVYTMESKGSRPELSAKCLWICLDIIRGLGLRMFCFSERSLKAIHVSFLSELWHRIRFSVHFLQWVFSVVTTGRCTFQKWWVWETWYILYVYMC